MNEPTIQASTPTATAAGSESKPFIHPLRCVRYTDGRVEWIDAPPPVLTTDERMKRLIEIAEMAMRSIRDYPCGHKPSGVSGHCEACAALKEWDKLSNPNQIGGGQ